MTSELPNNPSGRPAVPLKPSLPIFQCLVAQGRIPQCLHDWCALPARFISLTVAHAASLSFRTGFVASIGCTFTCIQRPPSRIPTTGTSTARTSELHSDDSPSARAAGADVPALCSLSAAATTSPTSSASSTCWSSPSSLSRSPSSSVAGRRPTRMYGLSSMQHLFRISQPYMDSEYTHITDRMYLS